MRYRVLKGFDYAPPHQPFLWRRWEADEILDMESHLEGAVPLNITFLLESGAIEQEEKET